ncbi:hypothetical protein [Paenibacillus sp. GYB003]|uniref:hypothetical protein n=1 Tax=Paenibacillus sp. GYB003 TaxID=2994392 RepID=UPI002F96A330
MKNKLACPVEQMQPFLTVSAGAEPAEYPEQVERLRSHREDTVSQVASLAAGRRFYRLKLEEGRNLRNGSSDIIVEEQKSKARLSGTDELFSVTK